MPWRAKSIHRKLKPGNRLFYGLVPETDSNCPGIRLNGNEAVQVPRKNELFVLFIVGKWFIDPRFAGALVYTRINGRLKPMKRSRDFFIVFFSSFFFFSFYVEFVEVLWLVKDLFIPSYWIGKFLDLWVSGLWRFFIRRYNWFARKAIGLEKYIFSKWICCKWIILCTV